MAGFPDAAITHYRHAELLLDEAEAVYSSLDADYYKKSQFEIDKSRANLAYLVATAQVHATLATVTVDAISK